jgi:DNA-binding winged helix-turn-helix (wHTH) protein
MFPAKVNTHRGMSAGIFKFGDFELDSRSGELRKRGRVLRLQQQPARVLATLVAARGEMVTREELRDRIWGRDTFVDFDRAINKAINHLRELLGDDADRPRFIETLPKRGYRFVADVAQSAARREIRDEARESYLKARYLWNGWSGMAGAACWSGCWQTALIGVEQSQFTRSIEIEDLLRILHILRANQQFYTSVERQAIAVVVPASGVSPDHRRNSSRLQE